MKDKGLEEYYFLEYAMESCFHKCSGKERDYIYSNHRAKRLLKTGYLKLVSEHPRKSTARDHLEGSIWYWPTEEGLAWWFGRRAEKGEVWLRRDSEYYFKNWGVEYMKDGVPNVGYLLRHFDGKGIGSQVELNVGGSVTGGLVWSALRDGLLKFVSHRDYSGNPHSYEEFVTVSLTKKGMAFFDALPRLELECA